MDENKISEKGSVAKKMLKALLWNSIAKNIYIMIVVGCALVYGALIYLDNFTEHGEYKVVPEVEGMLLSDAIAAIESDGFRWEVTDSVYDTKAAPGEVVEQNPKEASKVKSARTVFISINAFTPRMVSFPDVHEKSYRQGVSILEGTGFKDIQIKREPSLYDGLILDVSCDGKHVNEGDRLTVDSEIVITVGENNGSDDIVDAIMDDESEVGDIIAQTVADSF